MKTTGIYRAQATGVHIEPGSTPVPGIDAPTAHVFLRRGIEWPARLVADLRASRAMAAAWVGAQTLWVGNDEGLALNIHIDAAHVQRLWDSGARFVVVHVGADALPVIDMPAPPKVPDV